MRCKMYMWIQHFLFARTARVKLDGILSKQKSAFLKEYLMAVFCLPQFLVYINDILTTISKWVSNTLHADDLAMRLSIPPLQTTGSKKPSVVSTSGCWTGLETNISKTNNTLFSLSTSKEQIKLHLKDEIVPQTDTPTFLGVKLDTRRTCKPQIEKMERSSLQKLVLMRKLAGTTWGADSSIVTKFYTTNHGVCIRYVGNSCQDQKEQARQSPEFSSAGHTWSHENYPSV